MSVCGILFFGFERNEALVESLVWCYSQLTVLPLLSTENIIRIDVKGAILLLSCVKLSGKIIDLSH